MKTLPPTVVRNLGLGSSLGSSLTGWGFCLGLKSFIMSSIIRWPWLVMTIWNNLSEREQSVTTWQSSSLRGVWGRTEARLCRGPASLSGPRSVDWCDTAVTTNQQLLTLHYRQHNNQIIDCLLQSPSTPHTPHTLVSSLQANWASHHSYSVSYFFLTGLHVVRQVQQFSSLKYPHYFFSKEEKTKRNGEIFYYSSLEQLNC